MNEVKSRAKRVTSFDVTKKLDHLAAVSNTVKEKEFIIRRLTVYTYIVAFVTFFTGMVINGFADPDINMGLPAIPLTLLLFCIAEDHYLKYLKPSKLPVWHKR